jgi:hypothetical protein
MYSDFGIFLRGFGFPGEEQHLISDFVLGRFVFSYEGVMVTIMTE